VRRADTSDSYPSTPRTLLLHNIYVAKSALRAFAWPWLDPPLSLLLQYVLHIGAMATAAELPASDILDRAIPGALLLLPHHFIIHVGLKIQLVESPHLLQVPPTLDRWSLMSPSSHLQSKHTDE
jgi:hypothetical protein